MKKTIIFLFLLSSMSFSAIHVSAQSSADQKAINTIIDKFCQLEASGDMMTQAKMMSDDRVWIGNGAGRNTDQKKNMEMQQSTWDERKKLMAGAKWDFSARDRIIKTYGNGSTAVASFYWYSSVIMPASMAKEKAPIMRSNDPSVMTLVLEKRGSDWIIVHTQVSSLN